MLLAMPVPPQRAQQKHKSFAECKNIRPQTHIVVYQTNKWLLEQSDRSMVSWKEDDNVFIMSQRSSYLYILKPFDLSKLITAINGLKRIRT